MHLAGRIAGPGTDDFNGGFFVLVLSFICAGASAASQNLAVDLDVIDFLSTFKCLRLHPGSEMLLPQDWADQ